ncbi:hypothetical protein [Bacteroides sp. UBA939]|uniref:hypothetical protein n=1 Tax=Bacteroides sp. UBA939 TaxID=1946092 RepID=UPI0025B9DE05|nr:hypothetical protein [Bacteroides sp. UBA939]
MKDFNLKDLLIHILHGGIILLAVLVARYGFDIAKISCAIGNGITPTLFIVASYLIGLFIDPLADCVDTFLIDNASCFHKWMRIPFFPSYDFLKKGECWCLKLAHNVRIRHILNDDAVCNDSYRGNKDKTIQGDNKTEVWNNKKDIKLLFNYAKSRAFAYGSEYQLGRINNYFQLFIFYRNMMFTSTISLCTLLRVESLTCCCRLLIIILIPILICLFYMVSYKYRAYYCRMILGAVYRY